MIEFDQQKFEELVLYLASRFERETFFGATKLNKLLFFSDFLAYQTLGKPITGADYMALRRGPAPRKLLPIRTAMRKRGAIALDKRAFQERVIPLRDADLSVFRAEEIAIVDMVVEALKESDAETVSDRSHFLGWQAAFAEGEKTSIPYSTVFVSNRPADPFEEAHALQLAKRYGWTISTSER
jgi:hypothetical protein